MTCKLRCGSIPGCLVWNILKCLPWKMTLSCWCAQNSQRLQEACTIAIMYLMIARRSRGFITSSLATSPYPLLRMYMSKQMREMQRNGKYSFLLSSIPFGFDLFHSVLFSSAPFCSIVLEHSILYPVLFWPVLSCPVLFAFVALFCSVLSFCSVLFCSALLWLVYNGNCLSSLRELSMACYAPQNQNRPQRWNILNA